MQSFERPCYLTRCARDSSTGGAVPQSAARNRRRSVVEPVATVQIVSPSNSDQVSGTVDVRVRVAGGVSVSDVSVIIGPPEIGTRVATTVGGRDFVFQWDTTTRMSDATRATPSDALFWISAKATVDGVEVDAPFVTVTTENHNFSAAARPSGWRPQLAWAANYSGTLEQWRSSNYAMIGGSYATLQNDPILGSQRKAIKVSVPESAKNDADQATATTVRFQSSSVRNIVEGDEFCLGFAILPPADFPRVYPPKDPTNPRGPDGTSYIALFQFYGPPYIQGSPFLLQANRSTLQDPLDEFVIRGNELNPGDPTDYVAIPYRRGKWTDLVFRMHVSADINKGWVEAYVNQGESTSVRPLKFANGMHRVPRVLLRPESGEFRTDMQIYRVIERFDRVTVWHTGHKITQTVSEADPRSYRNGATSASGQKWTSGQVNASRRGI